MRTRSLIAFGLVLGALPACNEDTGGTDGGSDLAIPAGADLTATPPDMTAYPTGQRIFSGGAELVAMSDDDQVAFWDDDGALQVIAASGGKPTLINASSETVANVGKVIFSWTDTSALDVGKMTAWSAATGAKEIAAASVAGYVDVSADGQWMVYSDKATPDAVVQDIVVSKIDGTQARTLAARIAGRAVLACEPGFGFAGNQVLLASCPPAGDGGVGTATVRAFDPATGKATELMTGATTFFDTDKAGTKVFIIADNGDGFIVPIGGGTKVKIDSGITWGTVTSDGSAVIYIANNALKRAATTNPAPVTLVDSGVRGVDDFSPDESLLLFHGTVDRNGFVDLNLASTSKPGMPVLIIGQKGALYGDAFTADQSRVLYFAEVDPATEVGRLESRKLDASEKNVQGEKVWQVFATRGTQVVFNANFRKQNAQARGWADILVGDVTKPGEVKTLAVAADVDIFLTAAKDKVVYSHTVTSKDQGIYLAPIP